MGEIGHLWAVVPAGGAGTRLWPLSRAEHPKFLHDLTGSGRSLLQSTIDRLVPLSGDRVLVVTGSAHAAAVSSQLPDLPEDGLVVEPSPRDSMAAVGLAAALVERRDPDAVLGSFAADHVISDTAGFVAAVGLAEQAAREGWLVTVGMEPTYPATGFGYIDVGEPLPGLPGVCAVRAFVEKPSEADADRYLAAGHRWNAGMFVARPSVLLDLLAGTDPGFAASLRAIAAHPGLLADRWPTLPRISVDHAVAEPAAAAGRVAVVPAAFGWADVGDFAGLAGLLPPGPEGPRILGPADRVVSVDADGLVVAAGDRVVAVVGVTDVVVVDTPDALLVTSFGHAQRVKEVVAKLPE